MTTTTTNTQTDELASTCEPSTTIDNTPSSIADECVSVPTGVPAAMSTITNAIFADEGYAIGWYSNLVMAVIDSGVNRPTAERAANNFLSILFDVDIGYQYPSFPHYAVPKRPALGFAKADLKEVFDAVPYRSSAYGKLPAKFWGLDVELFDRETCETNPDQQQLLPYVVLTNTPSDTGVKEVFYYYRGASGGEARLHSKISIGLGGHVDNVGGNLYTLLQREGAREVLEEVGLYIDTDRIHFDLYLVDTRPDGNPVPVSSVHFGLLTVVEITDEERASIDPERDVITKGGWCTVDWLVDNHTDSLEPWSSLAAEVLLNT